MYILKTETYFDAAHFLAGYNGKCRNIHGHRWKIEAGIQADGLRSDPQMNGMVIDFSIFKRALEEVTEPFDHTLIFEQGTLRPATLQALKEEGFALTQIPFRPTAENLAKYFYDRMIQEGLAVYEIAVYETPRNCAVYRGK